MKVALLLVVAILVGVVNTCGERVYIDCQENPYRFTGWMRNFFFYMRGTEMPLVDNIVALNIPWISATLDETRTFEFMISEEVWSICDRASLRFSVIEFIVQLIITITLIVIAGQIVVYLIKLTLMKTSP